MTREQEIRDFILNLGVDDVGFADIREYNSPKSDDVTTFLKEGKSIIVLACKVLSSCESEHWSVALNGYNTLKAFLSSASYRTARFLETQYNAKVAVIPHTFPSEFHLNQGVAAEFSHRHAAVAAGLGTFGRNNLVLHPKFGTRVNFTSIITDLVLQPSPKPEKDICIHCNICVKNCPVHALDEEGCTDYRKCSANSLPYGDMEAIRFWLEVLQSPPERQKELFTSARYLRLRQAHQQGNQYMCFNCMKSCPVGVGKSMDTLNK
jgi:epoxyqueuosine reductase